MRFILCLIVSIACHHLFAKPTILKMALVDYPPRSINDSKPRGSTIELMDEIFKDSAFKIEYKFYPWARTFAAMNKGIVDLLLYAPAYADKAFKWKVDSGSPIFSSRTVLFYHRRKFPNGIVYKNLADLKNKKVGALSKSPMVSKIRAAGAIVSESTSPDSLFKKLIKGRLDFVHVEDLFGIYLLKSMKEKDAGLDADAIGISKSSPFIVPVHLAILKKNINAKTIRKIVDSGMKRLIQTGKYKAILSGEYAPFTIPTSIIPYLPYELKEKDAR